MAAFVIVHAGIYGGLQEIFLTFQVLVFVFFHRPQQNEIQLLPREIPLLLGAVLFIWFSLIGGKLRNGISTKVEVEHAGFYSIVQETFFTSLNRFQALHTCCLE